MAIVSVLSIACEAAGCETTISMLAWARTSRGWVRDWQGRTRDLCPAHAHLANPKTAIEIRPQEDS